MKSNLPRYSLILIVLSVLLSSACRHVFTKPNLPRAVNGVLDLTGWDFEKNGPVDLSGEYEFYWMQQRAPTAFAEAIPPQKTKFVKVPGYWNRYYVKGNKLPGDGYATYRLKILLDSSRQPLALKLLSMGTAFTAYANGEYICAAGVPGKNRETTIPKYFPQIASVDVATDRLEVVFHVSNFHHRRGGIWEVIKMGREKDLRGIELRRLGFDLFLFGSIFIMALYHLGLYAIGRKDLSPLYFGFFCFLISLRLLVTGETYLIHLLPDMSWEIMVKLEYLSFYLSFPIFALFMKSLFPQEISKRILNLVAGLGFVFSVVVLLTPARIFSHTLAACQIITLAAILYGVWVLVTAFIQKRDGAFIFLLGFLILTASAVNDMMHAENIVQTAYIVHFGLFIFIFSQAFLLSIRFTKALGTVEVQLKELKETYHAYKKEIMERVQADEALRESEEKYRTILHGIEDGYYEVDLAGNLTFFNEPLCKMLGYSRDELMGMNNRKYMTEETARRVFETYNRVYKTGEPSKSYDWEAVRKDGSKRHVALSVALMKDSEGRPIGFRGTTHDVTERILAEEQAKLHQEQLFQASKMVALGTLVSGVAHEINNPNNFIGLNTPILLEAWENAMPILEEYYKKNGDFIIGGISYTEMREKIPILFSGILDGSKRIKQIVEDLKNYVRKDSPDTTQPIDINAVLNSAMALVSNMIQKSTKHFSLEKGEALPLLTGNFHRLEQVFINLIQNACQALSDTRNRIRVTTSCDEEIQNIVVTVEDSGVGIPAESMQYITDPFFTTRQDSGGVGLGLAIASGIVQEHGGRMTFDSEPGKGTTARVYLPIDPVNDTQKGKIE